MTNIKYSLVKCQELNERDYGDLTGLNKDDARKKWEKRVCIWRRSFDYPRQMESLKNTAKLPFFLSEVDLILNNASIYRTNP